MTGPIFSPNLPGVVKSALRVGLFDVASEIAGTVHDQLFPGHGWVTGLLRESIDARQFSDLGYEVRSGAITRSEVVYTYWVETGKRRGRQTAFPGYRMFGNASDQWGRNNARIDQIMGAAMKRALS